MSRNRTFRTGEKPTVAVIETELKNHSQNRSDRQSPTSRLAEKWDSYALGGTSDLDSFANLPPGVRSGMKSRQQRILDQLRDKTGEGSSRDSYTGIQAVDPREYISRSQILKAAPHGTGNSVYRKDSGQFSQALPGISNADSQKFADSSNQRFDTSDKISPPFGKRVSQLDSEDHIYAQRLDQNLVKRIEESGYLTRLFRNMNQPGRSPREILFEEGKPYVIETYRSEDMAEILDEVAKEVTDFYRFIFNNQGHYLVYPLAGECLSPQEVFCRPKNEYVSLQEMDSLDPSSYRRHPITGELPIFWHDPEQTFFNMRKKLEKDADLTMVKSLTGEIMGMIFGKVSTLYEHFCSEEWRDPLRNSRYRDPKTYRDFGIFLERLNAILLKYPEFDDLMPQEGLDGNSTIYTWNTFATHPNSQAKGSTSKMMHAFFENLAEDRDSLIDVAEVRRGSKADTIFVGAGFRQIHGILSENIPPGPDESTIIAAPVRDLRRNYTTYSIRQIMQGIPTDGQGNNVLTLENDIINLQQWMKNILPEGFSDAFRVSNSFVADMGSTVVATIVERDVPGFVKVHTEHRAVTIPDYPGPGRRCVLHFNLSGWKSTHESMNGSKPQYRGLTKGFTPMTPIEEAFAKVLK